jgi:hypothetical protein
VVRKDLGLDLRSEKVDGNRTVVMRPVRPWVTQPYYGAVLDGVTLGAVMAATPVRRRGLSSCAGIVLGSGTSANNSFVHDLPRFSDAK